MRPTQGRLLSLPTRQDREQSNLARYMRWLEQTKGLKFASYQDLWSWSVEELSDFWLSIWTYFGLESPTPITTVLSDDAMPGARWFEGAQLNYAERALQRRDEHPALIATDEAGRMDVITFAQLAARVGAIQAGLRGLGVGRGDRVVSYMPNTVDTVAAFLATVGLGAVWSSCSPDFGWRGVTDRFRQLEPKVLFATLGYQHGGRWHDRSGEVRRLHEEIPSLQAVVIRDTDGSSKLTGPWKNWSDVECVGIPPEFTKVPFEHPLWVLYSSGTTGAPKGLVHSHGGIVLEHLKSLGLHFDLREDDRLFWYTTTGWMMWNLLVSNLLLGSTVVLYDGNAAHPTPSRLWQLAEEADITLFGTSAAFVHACMKTAMRPRDEFDLRHVRAVASTGSPLSPAGFEWVGDAVGVPIQSCSGGTDVCSGFFAPCALLPIYAGESPCTALGVSAETFDESGRRVFDEVGELVITRPMPSMPIYLWNDADGERYRDAYFNHFPGVWRHGDWVRLTDRGTAIIYGRSDSTLNRGGVRIGTSEIYRIVESIAGVDDSLVVDIIDQAGEGRMVLFVVAAAGDALLTDRIRGALRSELSPRHVPDAVYRVSDIPRTLNGKKLEVPMKRVLSGEPLDQVVNLAAVANPDAIRELCAAFAEVQTNA